MDGVNLAAATAEDVAVVILFGVGWWHEGYLRNTHLTVARDGNFGQAGTRLAGLGFACNVQRALASTVGSREGTHGTQLAAAVDTALNQATGHGNKGVALHRAETFVLIVTLTAAVDRASDNLAGDSHVGILCHLCHLAAAVDIALDLKLVSSAGRYPLDDLVGT